MPADRSTRNSIRASAASASDPSRPQVRDGNPTPDTVYTKGDFAIIAGSAGKQTLFRLPSYYMLAASAVIRDTYEIGTAGQEFKLDLSDGYNAVRLWLDVITGKNFDCAGIDAADKMAEALALCEQFDCVSAANTILAGLEVAVEHTGSARVILITSAKFGGIRPFAKCLGACGHKNWKHNATRTTCLDLQGIFAPDSPIRGPTNWSLKNFCLLPPAYAWALVRSFSVTNNLPDQVDKLKSLLAAIEEKDKAQPLHQSAGDISAEGEQ